MYTWTNLQLLRDELRSLTTTPFFSISLEYYLQQLITIVDRVIVNYPTLPPEAVDRFSRDLWRATKYLKGATSKALPYEAVYALKLALDDWITHPCEITTALSDDLDYHFLGVDPAQIIRPFFPDIKFGIDLIQISLPRLYRHRPLFNVALYHELGHYVDTHYRLSESSFLLDPKLASLRHRMEFFADLFAASYTGQAIQEFLRVFAGKDPRSSTHPSTEERIDLIADFLAGRQNAVADLFSNTLSLRKLPCICVRYKRPDISRAFNNIRTYRIADNEELHGILEAGWLLLDAASRQTDFPWNNVAKADVGRIVNDLIEKSIRNRMMVLKWRDANS